MIESPEIKVGLITSGTPEMRLTTKGTFVKNLLIGEGFHWEQTKEATFAGRIELLNQAQGNIHAVNILPIEQYIESVISSEMNPSAPREFLKAHAVISRSWAMRKLNHHNNDRLSEGRQFSGKDIIDWEESDSHEGFDVCSDDHCQRYQGINFENRRAIEAVHATKGEIIIDKSGNIADARFSKCCGGRTEIFSSCWANEDYEYLSSVEDPWCDLSDMDDKQRHEFLCSSLKNYDLDTINFHDWQVEINKTDIEVRLKNKYGLDVGTIQEINVRERGKSRRVTNIEITGDKDKVTIGKELAIRRLLSSSCLYSSWFDIINRGDRFILNGHGWGHGVGLCQIGAARMALEGKCYREIIAHYYPGTEIKKIYN